jgi:hypothetical protein
MAYDYELDLITENTFDEEIKWAILSKMYIKGIPEFIHY